MDAYEDFGNACNPIRFGPNRILDQVIYKWDHSRKIIANVLVDKYSNLLATGWRLEESEIERDVAKLFGGNFRSFLGK